MRLLSLNIVFVLYVCIVLPLTTYLFLARCVQKLRFLACSEYGSFAQCTDVTEIWVSPKLHHQYFESLISRHNGQFPVMGGVGRRADRAQSAKSERKI